MLARIGSRSGDVGEGGDGGVASGGVDEQRCECAEHGYFPSLVDGRAVVVDGLDNPLSWGTLIDGESLIASTCQCPEATDISSGNCIGIGMPLAVSTMTLAVTSTGPDLGGHPGRSRLRSWRGSW